MQCLQCGAEMRLVAATHDDTMMVPGYEDQTFECTGCREREQRRTFRSASAATATGAAEPLPAQLFASEAAAVQLGSLGAEPTEAATAEIVPAEAVPADSVPLEAASVPLEPLPEPVSSESSEQIDEDHELLSRAIAMVRSPSGGSRPLKGLTDGLKTAVALAGTMRDAQANRVVQIRHDPSCVAAYAAKDTRSGLVMLRHKDSARLRAMCERLGWQVVEDGTPLPDE
jgi:hypothetical protein